MKLLMHICCSGCALWPLKALQGEQVTGLWFNPNIHPEEEYSRRLGALKELEAMWSLDVLYEGGYGMDEFMAAVEAHDGPRCEACYAMRMRHTARRSVELGFNGFTTSLLASPYQRHEMIIAAAEAAAAESGARFYYQDFRTGWRDGLAIGRQLGLYRQYYCGCIFSKEERDRERAERKSQKAATAQKA